MFTPFLCFLKKLHEVYVHAGENTNSFRTYFARVANASYIFAQSTTE